MITFIYNIYLKIMIQRLIRYVKSEQFKSKIFKAGVTIAFLYFCYNVTRIGDNFVNSKTKNQKKYNEID